MSGTASILLTGLPGAGLEELTFFVLVATLAAAVALLGLHLTTMLRDRDKASHASEPTTTAACGTPRQDPPSDSSPTERSPEERFTVLVVDDNATVIRFVERVLRDTYAVRSASNGQEAFACAVEARPDLIISDVMMPVMNGHELCRRVKSDPKLRHIPVVMLTALASEKDLIEGLEMGSDDYICKPFNARELKARVRNLIMAREEQRRLAEANNELSTACETRSELLSLAAHDLKNPLAAVRALAEMVKEEVGAESEAFRHAELIRHSSDQMLHLIASLLESEAIDEGRIPMSPERLDLGEVAAQVIRRNDALARRKRQTIELRTAPGDMRIEADLQLLFEAMDNLVNNAIKYSQRGASIRVTVSRADDQVRFAVIDSGPGLCEEEQARLFRKFERLSPQPTGGESSTGLGLSIVKQIVELHEGVVEVKTAPGQGSTFSIELPAVVPDVVLG